MSHPLSRLESLLRIQMPGAPRDDIAGAIEDVLQVAQGGIGTAVEAVASPAAAPDDVLTRLGAVETAVAALKADIAAAPAATTTATDDPTVTQRLDAIDRAVVDVQGQLTKLQTAASAPAPSGDATDAIHKRLAALEARPVAAPARTPVPPRAASA